MAASYLTQARLALLALLQADATLAAEVTSWRSFGPGLRQRLKIEHSHCPVMALYPLSAGDTLPYNAADAATQDLTLFIVTSGQDAEPAETLAAAAFEVLKDARDTCLGLTAEGLTTVEISGVSWDAEPDEDGSHIKWLVRITVRLHFIRRR